MAKSARSNAKKSVNTWRRENLKAKWQDAADARRFELLAKTVEAPKPVVEKPVVEDAEMVVENKPEPRGRGRAGMSVDDDGQQKKGGKGVKVGKKGVLKPKKGKLFLAGKNQFHKQARKGRKGK